MMNSQKIKKIIESLIFQDFRLFSSIYKSKTHIFVYKLNQYHNETFTYIISNRWLF